ncbi:MAG: ABC transporter substrate-binding protein [Lachnospiraceae bacterium]|jgi:peptide/nickel transport system substrate-binding protein|nr:ABC transporter substrate-binding protein [Lachnospiraceae bacterium]
MKKKILAMLITAVMAVSLAACGGGEGSGTESDSFIYGMAGEITDFDPFSSGGTANSRYITFNIFEGLVKVSTDGTVKPAVAQNVDVNEDATVYTFTLRDGVKFHNGSEVTMDDVLYSVQKAVDAGLAGYNEIASFEAADEKTLVVTLNKTDAGFLDYFTQAVIPADSDDNGEMLLAPIGTGPYMFGEYEVAQQVTLKKFDEYWGEGGSIDEIVVKFLSDQNAQLTSFQSGAIDGFGGYGEMGEQINEENATITQTLSNMSQVLALNNAVEPFDDVRVRQAVALAVDSHDVLDTINYGIGQVVGSPVPPALTKYYMPELEDQYAKDNDAALELLKDAGYPDGFSFTVRVPSNYPVHVHCAEKIVSQLAEVGIDMKIEQVDWGTWLEKVYKGRDYEATLISVDGATISPTAFLARYVSDSKSNFMNFKSDVYDEAYAEALSATDEASQVEAFKAVQQILADECPGVFIEDIGSLTVYTKQFEGYNSYPLTAMDFTAVHKAE